MCGRGISGSSTGSPWNIGLFPHLSFILSDWDTNTLHCPCPFVQNLAHGGRVCAFRNKESMCGN